MRSSIIFQLAVTGTVYALPRAQAPAGTTPTPPATTPPPSVDLGGLLGGLDLGAILGGLGGAGGAAPDLGALIGQLGPLLGGLGGTGAPDTSTPVIIEGYTAVKEKATAFDAAIAAIPATGDAAAAIADVVAKAGAVATALKDAVPKISAIPAVDLMASGNLSIPGGEVTSLVEKTSDALVAKKDAIVAANQKGAVLEAAKGLKAATEAFTQAINAKLPPMSVDAATVESQRSLTAIDKVIAAFT